MKFIMLIKSNLFNILLINNLVFRFKKSGTYFVF